MLVLSRKLGEEICIGDNVRISIHRIQGKRVQIAIQAPASVRVDRAEVREAKSQERSAGVREVATAGAGHVE